MKPTLDSVQSTKLLVLLVTAFLVSRGAIAVTSAQDSNAAKPLGPPYAVVVNSHDRNPAKQVQQRRMYQRFLSRELVPDMTEDEFAARHPSHWPPEPDYQAVDGRAYCVDDTGHQVPIFFRTARDDYAYRYAIEKNRGADKVPGETTDFGYYTRLEPTSWEEPHTITQRRQKPDKDLNIVEYLETVEVMRQVSTHVGYIGYKDGVILYGSDFVPRAPFAGISKLAKKGHGHDWAVFVRPDALPLAQRKGNQQRFASEIGTQKQVRDGEPDSEYEFRNSRLTAYEDLVRAFWMDVESFAWTVTEATPDKPYRTRIELVAHPDSKLAKQLGSLRAARPPTIPSTGAWARLYTAFTIPKEYRNVFAPLARHSKVASTAVGQAISDFVVNGACRSRLHFSLDENSKPALRGIVATRTESLSAETIASNFERPNEKLATIPWVFRTGDWKQAVVLNAEIAESNLCFSVAADQHASRRPVPSDDPNSEDEDAFTLVAAHVDLSPLAELESSHPARELLSNMEWLVRLLAPKPEKNERRVAHPFQSLTHHIAKNGDWTLDCTIKQKGDNRLELEAQIGSDLITLWRCRQIIDGLHYLK